MRMALAVLLLAALCNAAQAQPQDVPLRPRLTPAAQELEALRLQRDEVSYGGPGLAVGLGAGLLLTGLAFDAATAGARPQGGVSVLGALCYVASAFLVPQGGILLLARMAQRWMLSGHIRDVEAEMVAEGPQAVAQ